MSYTGRTQCAVVGAVVDAATDAAFTLVTIETEQTCISTSHSYFGIVISFCHISVVINYQFWPHQCQRQLSVLATSVSLSIISSGHQCRYQLSVLATSVSVSIISSSHQCQYQLSVLAISVGFIIGVSVHLMFRWCRAASRTLALQCLSGSGWQPSANTAISSSPNCTNNSGDPPRVQEEAMRERGEVEATSG